MAVFQTSARMGAFALSALFWSAATLAQTLLPVSGAAGVTRSTFATVAEQVPLRIRVTARTRLKRGAPVEGMLLEPVFAGARMVLPAGSVVSGRVIDTPPVDRGTRVAALLDGDFTPLHAPVVSFAEITLPSGAVLSIDTVAYVRQAELIRFVPRRKHSRLQDLKSTIAGRVQQTRDDVTAPHKSDRLLRLLYNQLPYHPQRIWANTDFDAELQSPLTLAVAAAAAVEEAPADTLLEEHPIVRGRLTADVSSDTAKNGDAVHAVLTEPVYDSQHRLIFPEGAALTGQVLQSKPSRSFGRNGVLRFAFRSMQPAGGEAQTLQGQVTGAEGETQANVTVDEEGGVHAHPDKNRFAGPLLLAVLAAGGQDEDGGAAKQGLASNGLGIVVRVVGLAAGSRNFALGVGAYGFSKSIYRHFLAHGKPVAFPRNTQVEVQLFARR